ncbi:MAG: hypothetical protein HRU09_14400 [Oligoflexales bacterium]|nr:hypothetical protein [Oligoflexales bacterium]
MFFLLLLALFCSGLSQGEALQFREFDNIVAFGDSFTDDGPADGSGFYRASNGETWVEYLAKEHFQIKLQNNTWSGSTSGFGNVNQQLVWSGLLWQVSQVKNCTDPRKTLVFVWSGLNDLYDGKGTGLDLLTHSNGH